ncbi:AI-2E family transporter, partial [Sneathia sp. DSM 16630]|nr:AI-2E family transporter [Sneathia sp. DSM 16630]
MYNFDIKRLTPIIYVVSVLILLILIFKVLIFLLPFVIAAVIVRMLSPIVNRMSNKNKFTKSIVLLSFYVFVFIIVSLILVKIFLEAYNLFSTLIKNQDYILAHVTHALDKYEKYVSKLPDYSENLIDELVSKVLKYFNGTILNLLNSSINMLKMLPRLVVFIIVTILSSFIIINDKNIIVKF